MEFYQESFATVSAGTADHPQGGAVIASVPRQIVRQAVAEYFFGETVSFFDIHAVHLLRNLDHLLLELQLDMLLPAQFFQFGNLFPQQGDLLGIVLVSTAGKPMSGIVSTARAIYTAAMPAYMAARAIYITARMGAVVVRGVFLYSLWRWIGISS